MLQISITAIELTNHGPVRGTRRFQFAETGLNVYVQPNECGKTTLLDAVCAVLWGRSDLTKHWHAGAGEPHWAALELLRRGDGAPQRLRIQRDFETHALTVVQLNEGRPSKELFRGAHNPDGRTADHRRWPQDFLPRLWAPVSCEAFRNVAMLLQPAPDPLQTSLVQEMTSGSAGTADGAKQVLVESYRKLSKLSAQAGLGARNARNDGQLENLQAQREQLAQEMSRGAGEFARIEQLRTRQEQLEARRTAMEQRLLAIQQGLATIKILRERKQELDRAVQQAEQLARVQAEARKAAEDAETARSQAQQLPVFLREMSLPVLGQVEQELAAYRERRAVLVDPQRLLTEQQRLEDEYRDVLSWPDDAGQKVEAVRQAQQRHDQAQSQRAAAQTRVDGLLPQANVAIRALATAGAGLAGVLLLLPLGVWAAGVWGAMAGAVLAAVAAALTWAFVRPQRPHPDRQTAAQDLAAAKSQLQQAQRSLAAAQAAVGWTTERDLPRLIQLAERRNALRRELAALRQRQAEQNALRQELDPQRCSPGLGELLAHCQGDPQAAAEMLRQVQQIRTRGDSAASRLQSVLGPLECADLVALDARLAEWTDRRAVIRREVDQHARENALAEELAAADGAQVDARRAQLEHEQAALTRELSQLQQQQLEAGADLQIAQRGIGVNLAEGELALRQLDGEVQRLQERCRAIAQAHQLLDQAAQQYSTHHRAAIEARINEWMNAWTQRAGRSFTLGAGFELGCQVTLPDGTQELQDTATLSQGARDQLGLAARLAVLERVGADVLLPLLVDDAFLAWDGQRRQRLLSTLEAACSGRQVILVSHDPAFAAWGRPVMASEVRSDPAIA